MAEEDDYIALSSSHGIKVNKETKKVETKYDYMLGPGEEAYKQFIAKLDETYQKIEEKVFKKLLNDVTDFIKSKLYHEADQSPATFRYIPCAMISMPSDISSSNCFSDQCAVHLENIATTIITISSDDVKSVLDFVNIIQNYLIEEDEKIPPKFYGLTAKYFYDNFGSEKPIIIIFNDFDSFNSSVLSDLLILMKENLDKMPVILICCQSSDLLSLNMRLPSRATDCLSIETFSSQSTKEFFYQLLNDICLNPDNSFKLGPKSINHLINIYNYWDISLSGIYRRVKLAVFNHFYDAIYSRLCCRPEDIKLAVSKLTDLELTAIRKLPSLKGRNFPKEINLAKSQLQEILPDFHEQLEIIITELSAYHYFKKILFAKKLNFLQDTWIPFLESNCYTSSEDFRNTCMAFSDLAKDDIIDLMGTLLLGFNDNHSDIISTLKSHYTGFEDKVKEIVPDKSDEVKTSVDPIRRTRASSGLPLNSRTTNNQRGYRFADFKSQCQQNLVKSVRPVKRINKWKDEFLDHLKEGIDKITKPFDLPFNEIFFFDDIDTLKKFSLPSSRQDKLDQLENPRSYLCCKCCSRLNNQSPDLSIMYVIYCESLRVANLKQWFDCFKEFVNRCDARCSPRKRKKKEPDSEDKEILARFMSTLSDMEYIGLLRAHRKQDHVERLVWPLIDYSNELSDSDEAMSESLGKMNVK